MKLLSYQGDSVQEVRSCWDSNGSQIILLRCQIRGVLLCNVILWKLCIVLQYWHYSQTLWYYYLVLSWQVTAWDQPTQKRRGIKNWFCILIMSLHTVNTTQQVWKGAQSLWCEVKSTRGDRRFDPIELNLICSIVGISPSIYCILTEKYYLSIFDTTIQQENLIGKKLGNFSKVKTHQMLSSNIKLFS